MEEEEMEAAQQTYRNIAERAAAIETDHLNQLHALQSDFASKEREYSSSLASLVGVCACASMLSLL
jgi:hypothetical protein